IDGRDRGTWPVAIGNCTIDIPFNDPPGLHSIELHFANGEQLPSPDSRNVAGHIEFLGFQ
ncbi:MAG: hypothetical protein ABR975_15560, partial [Vulcanimicrobiaceae bacterium]